MFSAGGDLTCDVAVCGVDNNSARVTTARYFRKWNVPVIFTAVSADADHGYVLIQEADGPCVGCLFPGVDEDELFPCPGTPAIADILQLMGAFVTYAIDSVLTGRTCSWNYRAAHLYSGDWDTATIRGRKSDCRICTRKEVQ